MKEGMLRIIGIIFVLTAICCHSASLATVSEARKQELIRMADKDENLDLLAPEEKEVALQYLLEEKAKRPDNLTWSDKQLLQLAHEPTIQRYGERMKAGFIGFYQIGPSRQPRLIEFCENLLMKKEPPVPPGGGDILSMSDSVCAARLMMQLTRDAVEMPAETRIWAQDMAAVIIDKAEMRPTASGRRIAEEARLIVRNWFAENKAALKALEFTKVKPGVVHSFLKVRKLAPSPDDPTNILANGKPPQPAPPDGGPAKTSETPMDERKENSWALALVGGCAALLAAGIYFGARRAKQR